MRLINYLSRFWFKLFPLKRRRSFSPHKVEISINPPENRKTLRGPVDIYWFGLVFEACEINYGDENECQSVVKFPNGKFGYANYSRDDIEGLNKDDIHSL
ncbi:hypothetical protein ACFL13_01280 [Patescibacteria group bacterium]